MRDLGQSPRAVRGLRRIVIRSTAVLVATLLSLSLAPRFLPAVAGPADITSTGSGPWNARTTWSCNCIPTSGHNVLIRSGHAVVVNGDAQARSITVQGVLQASRTVTSVLTLYYGNLIVTDSGWLDYGTRPSPIPQSVTARIRFLLDESRYVGGRTMAPLDSDVGLWVIMRGRVTTAGPDRGAWTTLQTTARSGANQIVVDTRHVTRWYPGDEIVVGPTNIMRTSRTTHEDERRIVVADLGAGRYQLNQALAFTHTVQTVTWDDPNNDTWSETLVPPVANLTRNIVFEAANPDHRPHVMIMDEATVQLEDLAIVGFSPVPRNIGMFQNANFALPRPFARYALHFHVQGDASRASRLRQVVIRDGMGKGLVIHSSNGVVAEDVVIYNQARAQGTGDPGTQPLFLEPDRDNRGIILPDTGARDAWIDRPLVIRFGQGSGTQRVTGLWLGGGAGAYVVGAHVAGSLGTGVFWCAGCGNPQSANPDNPERTPRVLRATVHSVAKGFFWWQNQTPPQDIIDLVAWNNRIGLEMGAYGTQYTVYHGRAIGNSDMQFTDHANGSAFINFLADGQSRGAGVVIQPYQVDTDTDTRYEVGVIRGVTTAATFDRCLQNHACGSAVTTVQFHLVEFEADPVLRYVWHPRPTSLWRIRGQTGLRQPANFTLYRPDRRDVRGVYDPVYEAIRVNGDTAETFAPPPRVRLVSGAAYPGCALDDAVVSGTVTLCAETTATTVEFFNGPQFLGRVTLPNGGFAQTSFDMRSWPHRRAYFHARGISANGRYNYSRVIRVRKF